MSRETNEERYYLALKRITEYQSPDRMRRHSERDWGLPFEEVLEMAYDNIQNEAKTAIHGKRRPKLTNGKPEISGQTDPEAPISGDAS